MLAKVVTMNSKLATGGMGTVYEAEQENPRLLDRYALYIETNSYDQAYLVEARHKIDVAAEAMRRAVEADGRLGRCVDASGMLGRMLDRLGVWNWVAKSTLTL
ncbi:MAG: hypothetical protein IH921_02110, partial [Gemmatimonadetes bacterium]|nr:hypothetical protein [Gemmatimonadota bacterium]